MNGSGGNMKEFFLNQNTCLFSFKMFNMIHFISVAIVLVLLLLIVYNKDKISKVKNKTLIRILFGFFLIVIYILRRGSFVYYSIYNWRYHLSLGFCNMTNILFIIYCLSGNKKIYNLCYYFAFCGPLLSILFPVINIGINNYSFINFLMIHHVIFLMNVVFAIFESKKPIKKDLINAYVYGVLYIIITHIFNHIMGTNYNELNQFIANSLQQNSLVIFMVENKFINYSILFLIGLVFVIFGHYVLKILNLRSDNNEENNI